MKWHSHETSRDTVIKYDMRKDKMDRDEFYRGVVTGFRASNGEEDMWQHQGRVEFRWERNNRPFYNVWPSVVEGLARLKLGGIGCADVREAIAKMPMVVCLRFAEGHELRIGEYRLRCVLASKMVIPPGQPDAGEPGVTLIADAGERGYQEPYGTVPVYWNVRFGLDVNRTVEEEINSLSWANITVEERAVTIASARVYLSIALMRNDPELVECVVLKKDEKNYMESRNK